MATDASKEADLPEPVPAEPVPEPEPEPDNRLPEDYYNPLLAVGPEGPVAPEAPEGPEAPPGFSHWPEPRASQPSPEQSSSEPQPKKKPRKPRGKNPKEGTSNDPSSVEKVPNPRDKMPLTQSLTRARQQAMRANRRFNEFELENQRKAMAKKRDARDYKVALAIEAFADPGAAVLTLSKKQADDPQNRFFDLMLPAFRNSMGALTNVVNTSRRNEIYRRKHTSMTSAEVTVKLNKKLDNGAGDVSRYTKVATQFYDCVEQFLSFYLDKSADTRSKIAGEMTLKSVCIRNPNNWVKTSDAYFARIADIEFGHIPERQVSE